MSAPVVLASSEVTEHRIAKHFPCLDRPHAVQHYVCSCGSGTLLVCAHCGECFAIHMGSADEWCEHSQRIYEVTDGLTRTARVVSGRVVIDAQIVVVE